MANRQSQSSPGRSIGPKLVGHQQSGRKATLLEQFAHEPRGCPGVAPPLHQQIKNFTPSSTARQSQNCLPLISTAISSRCHCEVGR